MSKTGYFRCGGVSGSRGVDLFVIIVTVQAALQLLIPATTGDIRIPHLGDRRLPRQT